MIFLLLVLYQLKHLACDYFLQGKYMLGKFKPYPDYVLPLTAHAAVHGVATYAIAFWVKPELALTLALFDFTTHWMIDRVKASPNLLGRFKPLSGSEMKAILSESPMAGGIREKQIQDTLKGNKYFWWSLGADQMAHHLVHYLIIWRLIS